MRTLTAVGRRRQRHFTTPGWQSLLDGVIEDLEGLNGRTEQEFLTIGEKLMEFLNVARQIAADMAALSELISGSLGRHASQALARVLDRSRQAEALAETGDRTLAGVCDDTRSIGRTFGGFRDTVSFFRVLGSLTRIETARLGSVGAGFGSLAEEVNTLTHSIESSGQGIVDASSTLHRNMHSALARVTDLRAGELDGLPALVGEVMTSFESLEDRHRQGVEVSLHQAAEYEKISGAIGDLITAIQFHDITRQQSEHVVEALRRLRSEFHEGDRNHSAAPADARAVLALQSSQLANAGQMFASSVGRIEQDLDSIAERVRNMAGASKTLMGQSAGEQDLFFVQMESRFTGIVKAVGTCAQAEAEIHGTLGELAEAVEHMRESVSEVREIEISIRRTAINATIRAVHIGDAGNALLVLADVMQRLALDANGIVEAVAGSLDSISAAASRLSRDSSDAGADDVLTDMRTTILELHSSGEAGFSRLNEITALSSRLVEEIRSVRAGFSAGTLFADAVHRARRTLEQIQGLIGPARSGETEIAPEGRMEDFAAHYTMHAERLVHQSVAAGGGTGPREPVDEPGTAPDKDTLGENVELF
jgi:hypothetical protein